MELFAPCLAEICYDCVSIIFPNLIIYKKEGKIKKIFEDLSRKVDFYVLSLCSDSLM